VKALVHAVGTGAGRSILIAMVKSSVTSGDFMKAREFKRGEQSDLSEGRSRKGRGLGYSR